MLLEKAPHLSRRVEVFDRLAEEPFRQFRTTRPGMPAPGHHEQLHRGAARAEHLLLDARAVSRIEVRQRALREGVGSRDGLAPTRRTRMVTEKR